MTVPIENERATADCSHVLEDDERPSARRQVVRADMPGEYAELGRASEKRLPSENRTGDKRPDQGTCDEGQVDGEQRSEQTEASASVAAHNVVDDSDAHRAERAVLRVEYLSRAFPSSSSGAT